MKKNILILGLGAFGFAVAKYLGENNPDQIFYVSEKNPEIFKSIEKNGEHPYFFKGLRLPENIKLVGNEYFHNETPYSKKQGENSNSEKLNKNIHSLQDVDIIISVIPCQFVAPAFSEIKDFLKDGVIILNLAKGIDNQSLETMSKKLETVFNVENDCNRSLRYTYAYLAGGMIAQELIDKKILGADLVTENIEAGEILKKLFQSQNLDIHLKIGNSQNTELYAALKNVVALILGYYEGQGSGASTLGYYFSKLLGEITKITKLLHTNEVINFSDYALSGDLIATCFGNSRNRLLGNMLGKGMNIEEALGELKSQKKIAEGYETLKAIAKIIEGQEGLEEIEKFSTKYL